MGVTQAEAAALLNVSQRTWWRWEKGISKPHPRHYRRYAALLKEWAGI
jgi:transcriptional regulator with XRE-family HTH domain